MSNDEKLLAIGKLSAERAEAKRTLALITQRIRDVKDLSKKLYESLSLYDLTKHLSEAELSFDQLRSSTLATDLVEYRQLNERIQELTESLRGAGVE